uniref:Reverse transcriptase domain-containing protein n=1 Tax=Maylandia zebra TaxID=106582 RepID=A0A3P9DFW8_9CICH
MFADDVLVCLEEPERSFSELMSTLSDLGKLSGYKVNISKTQVMTLNYTASVALRRDNEKNKYLGIYLTADLSGLFQANYEPISFSLQRNIWNLTIHVLKLFSPKGFVLVMVNLILFTESSLNESLTKMNRVF